MTKEEFLKIKRSHDDILKIAYETATIWMKHYLGEGNTYGYKVGHLYLTDESIVFQFYHYDGCYPSDHHTIPLDFVFDPTGMNGHAEKAKVEYQTKRAEDFKIEQQIRELQNKLQIVDHSLIQCGTIIPRYQSNPKQREQSQETSR